MSAWAARLEREGRGLRRLAGIALALGAAARDREWQAAAPAIPARIRGLLETPGCAPRLLTEVAAGRAGSELDRRRLAARPRGRDPAAEAAATLMRRRAATHGLRLREEDLELLDAAIEDRLALAEGLDGVLRGLEGPEPDAPGLRADAARLAGHLSELAPVLRAAEARLCPPARRATRAPEAGARASEARAAGRAGR